MGLRAYCYVHPGSLHRENTLDRVTSLPPPSHQNPNQNTRSRSVFTLYFLSLSQHEENTKQKKLICIPTSLLSISSGLQKYIHPPVLHYTCHIILLRHLSVSAFHNQLPSNKLHRLKGDERNSKSFSVPSKNRWRFLSHFKRQTEKGAFTLSV